MLKGRSSSLRLQQMALSCCTTTAATPKASASQAFATQIGYLFNSQFDRLYNALTSHQQRLITRDRFLTCYERAPTSPRPS
jgi:hypothetical protein